MKDLIPNEYIQRKIMVIRNKKVILDKDLAKLYEVKTRDLNKAVTRNKERFPEDFMFRLNKTEFENLKFHFGTSSWGGTRKKPRAFTEQGVSMLSSVLKSKKAIKVNIQIMRVFTQLREVLSNHEEIKKKIEIMERKYDKQFSVVFEAIKTLIYPTEKPKKIGFLREND